MSLLTLILESLIATAVVVNGFTIQDIRDHCETCPQNYFAKIPHPKDCTKYATCDKSENKWRVENCPASTHFDAARNECVFLNRQVCKAKEQEYSQQDVWVVNNKVCRKPDDTTGAGNISEKDPDFITKLLVGLLVTTFALLIALVIGIVLYRRRQLRKRPTNFSNRRLPPPTKTQPQVNNAAYMTHSLISRRSEEEGIYSEARPDSGTYEDPEGATYTEISENMTVPPSSDKGKVTYYSLPPESKKPLVANASYMSAIAVKDAHMYAKPQEQVYSDSNQYDYAQEDSLNEIRRGSITQDDTDYQDPVDGHPTLVISNDWSPSAPPSPPYYIDPIADDQCNLSPPAEVHNYHTLEPPKK